MNKWEWIISQKGVMNKLYKTLYLHNIRSLDPLNCCKSDITTPHGYMFIRHPNYAIWKITFLEATGGQIDIHLEHLVSFLSPAPTDHTPRRH
jgi:hypothetical protein